MNIFVLDIDPKKAAEYHCDKHVHKMIIESIQMLSTTHHLCPSHWTVENKEVLYKHSFDNHPCTKWVRESKSNYQWLCELALNLCYNYELRYKKVHSAREKVILLESNIPNLPNIGLTPFALAMDDKYKKLGEFEYSEPYNNKGLIMTDFSIKTDVVESYRNYYIEQKFIERDVLRYKYSQIPNWLQMGLAKRASMMPKHDPIRKRIEEFLSGKINEKPIKLSIKKGDTIKLKTGEIALISGYSSNLIISIHIYANEERTVFSNSKVITKEDILELAN